MRTAVFSELNTFRFVPLEAIYRYNTRHFDDDWFRNQILSWQVKTNYQQKVQNGDSIYIQMLSNVTAAPTIRLYSCEQTDPLATSTFTNTTYTVDGYRVYATNLSELFATLQDGTYYLTITIEDADGEQSWITEPIAVASFWRETTLLRYKHYHNKDHVEFERTGVTMSMRIESALIDFEPGVNRVSYEAQDGDLKLLSAVTFRSFQWVAGGNGKTIPDYVISKLNHVWACSDVWVDGKKFVAADGAGFEKSGADRFPKYAAGIEVREASNNTGVIYTSGGFLVMSMPAYPFVIETYSIRRGTSVFAKFDEFVYMGDPTMLATWLAEQNATKLQERGLFGQLIVSGSQIIYEPVSGENVDNGVAVTLTQVLSFNQTVPAGTENSTTLLQLAGAGAPYAVIYEDAIQSSGYVGGVLTSVILSGAPNGIRNFRLFHREIINFMFITDAGDTNYSGGTLSSVIGNVPNTLTQFWLSNCGALTLFNFINLARARTSLKVVQITNNSAYNNLGLFHITGTNSFTQLNTLRLNGNAITVANVNAFFNSMYSAMTDPTFPPVTKFVVYGGSMNIRQTPAAAPTGASSIARSALSGAPYSWTVLTD